MAEISLRAYIKEIDNLIEHDQLDEAIAHCRHTLEFYPKLLAIYRSLGKAYLEAKRYGDAADVFQRVLSAAPDDFVSQIGMAIVREDEGNLDSAIWHMERAFETNPANPAIQQELRRLIGNRDGIEPAKVRMTRAALARMYAHGELYPQAIAELKSALVEDTDRPDMQVLLAMMLWRTKQFVEAAEISSIILEKLPYCRDANRIMAAILQESNKPDEASTYHRRLAALDPYAAFIETASIDPHTVDENTVRIDKLEWRPGQPMPVAEPGQPEWAASLGVKLGDDKPEAEAPIPRSSSWLEELEKSAKPPKPEPRPSPSEPAHKEIPASTPEQEEEAIPEQPVASSSEIPEWMRDAGWVESSGETQEQPVSFSDEEMAALDAGQLPSGESTSDEGEDEGELAPAQIPGWMKEIAPSEAIEGEAEPPTALPDWIGDIAADIEEVRPDPGEAAPPEEALSLEDIVEDFEFPELTDQEQSDEVVDTGNIPAWLDSEEPGATSTIITWLGKRSPEDLAEEERRKEEARQRVQSELPATPPIEEADAALDGLRELAAQRDEDFLGEDLPPEEGAPSWLAGVAEVAAQQAEEVYSTEELEPADRSDEIPEEALEARLESQEELLPVEQPESAVEAPDWLLNIAAEEGSEATGPVSEEELDLLDRDIEVQSAVAMEPSTEEAAAADWLQSISDAVTSEHVGLEAEDLLANLRDLPEEAALKQEAAVEDSPEWLADRSDTEEPADWLEGLAEEDVPQPKEPSLTAPDWLSGIGEDEGEIEISPEELFPTARVPDWLQGIAEPGERKPTKDLQPDLEGSDWLDGISEPERPGPSQLEVEDETIDWLRGIVDDEEEILEPPVSEVFPDIPPEPAAAIASEELDDEEIFDWLQDLADRQTVEEEAPRAPVEGVRPTPIQEMDDRAAEEIISDVALPGAPGESLEWLESLASQRGIDHDVGMEPVSPEPIYEEPPEEERPSEEVADEALAQEASKWLGRMATQPLKEQPATPEAELEPKLDMRAPDWLKEIAGDDELPISTEAVPDIEETLETIQEPQPPSTEVAAVEPAAMEAIESPLPEELGEEAEAVEMKVPDWLQAKIESAPVVEEVEPALPDEIAPDLDLAAPEQEVEALLDVEPVVPAQPVEQTLAEPEPEPTGEALEEEVAPIPTAMEEPKAEVAPEQPPMALEPEAGLPLKEPVPSQETISAEEEHVAEVAISSPEPESTQAAVQLPVEEAIPESVAPEVEDAGAPPTPQVEAAPVSAPEPEPAIMEVEEAPPVAVTPEPAPAPSKAAPKRKAAKFDPAETLETARQALAAEDLPGAVKHYGQLIKRGKELDKVIEDLRLALDRDAEMPTIWQILGDAYMKDDKLQEAIAAYKRGTEVA